MTFADPLWLLVLLLVIPVAWSGRRWTHAMSRWRAWSCVAARSTLVALVALILAGGASVRETERMAVIALVDVSESVRLYADRFGTFPPAPVGEQEGWAPSVERWLRTIEEERGPDDLLGLIVFDGGQIAVSTPRSGDLTSRSLDFSAGSGTDLGGALRFAEALFPPDARRRLVVISDGNDTTGALSREIERLAARSQTDGASVDVIPIAYTVRNEVLIEGVDAPPTAASGSKVVVRVILNATEPTTGSLDLVYNDRAIDINGPERGSSLLVRLERGRNVVPVTVDLEPNPVHRFEPIFTPDQASSDGLAANNRGEAFTVTPDPGVVGVVSPVASARTPELARVLGAAGIEAVALSPGELPTTLLGLHRYDLIILDNVARPDVPEPIQRNLTDYVRSLGGGLVMSGGRESFGAGGWKGSALEELLPVSLDLPDEIIEPSAAIVFVIDRSGSMSQQVLGGARSRLDIAKESTALAISSLDKTDLAGVISFSDTNRIDIALGRNADSAAAGNVVRTISHGGGTNMYPAIRRAQEMLLRVDASVKHVIVLSDGATQGRDAMIDVAIGQQLRENGISISTIGVGDAGPEAADSLRIIATQGGGTYYPVIDPNTLPRIFLKEVIRTRTPAIREGPVGVVPLASGSALTLDLGWGAGSVPDLLGINITQPREDLLITYALASDRGEPLLAHWYVGQGQVAAFTSETDGTWARRWLRPLWSGYSALWTRIARTIARPSGSLGYELTTQIDGDELIVRVDAYEPDGTPVDLLSMPGSVYTPDGRKIDVRLAQVGPGSYEGRVSAPERGSYAVAITPEKGGRGQGVVLGGATRAVGPELANLRSDTQTLLRLAERTGGRRLNLADPDAMELFDRSGLEPTRASTPLWPVLLAWAIVVFALDVGTRRIAWDRLLSRDVIDSVREQATGVVRERSERAAGVLASLRDSTKRAERPQATERAPAPMRHRTTASSGAERVPDESLSEAKKAQEARRKAMRKKMLEELSGDGSKKRPGSARPEEPKKREQAEGDTTSGLLAAKKRARDRFAEDGLE